MEFSEILKDIMLDNNFTQTELASKTGLKQSQISEWLKGKSKPGNNSLKALSIALNFSADILLGIQE